MGVAEVVCENVERVERRARARRRDGLARDRVAQRDEDGRCLGERKHTLGPFASHVHNDVGPQAWMLVCGDPPVATDVGDGGDPPE